MSDDHCPHKRQPGGCDLHNLHCGYPKCNEPPATAMSDPNLPLLPSSFTILSRLQSGTEEVVGLDLVEQYGLSCYTAGAAAAQAEVERLRTALRFYARGQHYHTDDDEDVAAVAEQARPEGEYVNRLIDRLLMPPQAMAASDLTALMREAAQMLHLKKVVATSGRAAPESAQPASPPSQPL